MKYLLTILLFCLFTSYSFSQIIYDYGFKKDYSIPVSDSSGKPISMAWGGGLNSAQFSEIDLNMDGINDLFIFDKSSSRMMTLINLGIPDSSSYIYDFSWQKYFPSFYGWVNLTDYNCDGKTDIFTYNSPGIMIYKNISDSVPEFQMLYSMLESDMGGSSSNIAVTYDDWPAFADVDGDGDTDVLVFFGLGMHVEMHKNLSMETYGNCDTILLKLRYHCWGDFAESGYNNQLTLNIACPWTTPPNNIDRESRHTGSTMLATDMNNDNLIDFILGDVDYFNLVLLTNGGTPDSAHMISQDTLFPSVANPVWFNSFPLPCYLDVNNDDKKDLVVSPFTSNPTIPTGINSVWQYENTGSDTLPQFTFVTEQFLQDQMIDLDRGAYPVAYDYNSDGLMDLLVGNYGSVDSSYYEFGYLKVINRSQLALLENTGTPDTPSFKLITRDYAGLSSLKLVSLYPTFADLDNDGDIDMLTGDYNGKLQYFENTAGPGNIPVYAAPVLNYQSIDAGYYAAPQLLKLDNDTLIDLVIGNRSGMITYYKNTGSVVNPLFTHVTDSLGKVDVTDYYIAYSGSSTPCFFRDNDTLKLFVGSESGKIFYYKNIDNNLSGKFTANDSVLVFVHPDSATYYIFDGQKSGVAVYDFNNDGYKDIVSGNYSGGLSLYYGRKPKSHDVYIGEYTLKPPPDFTIFPNPASGTVNIELGETVRAFDVLLYDITGKTIMQHSYHNSSKTGLDISTLSNGLYFINILFTDKSGRIFKGNTKKLMVSK